jgi:hypothetical protein
MISLSRFTLAGALLALSGCAQPQAAESDAIVRVSREVVTPKPQRLGVNLGASYYYGDQQHVANAFGHGGFSQGRQVLMAQAAPGATADSFKDSYFDGSDPDRNYVASFAGGEYCIATGARAGEKGEITGHDLKTGAFTLSQSGAPLEENDAVWLRGSWTSRTVPDPVDKNVERTIGIGDFRPIEEDGVTVSLVPSGNSERDQAVRITFPEGAGRKRGGIKHYIRSVSDNTYTVHVRAKASAPGMELGVALRNFGIPHPDVGNTMGMEAAGDTVLTTEYKDYAFTCTTPNDPRIIEETAVFEIVINAETQSDTELTADIDAAWLEDGDLKSEHGFNRAMAEAMKEARCGTLRFYGVSSLAGLVDDFTAASTTEASWTFASLESLGRFNSTDAVLDEWMGLSLEVGAQPWVTVGSANTPDDWHNLISYLCSPAGHDEYSQRRAAHGFEQPWVERFDKVYLEIGNEWWNPVFRPYYVMPPQKYGELCRTILKAVRAHPHFDASRIELVIGGWAINGHHWNGESDKISEGHTMLSVAPYLLHELSDYVSTERRYQALFADVEAYALDGGTSTLADLKANGKGTRVAVYELNTHITGGGAPASIASEICPSAGAGVAVLDQAMALMRDMGASPINYFTTFQRHHDGRLGLWGSMVRTPDGSLRARPVWEGLRLANTSLIAGDMVAVSVEGSPTWDQPENGSVPELDDVPFLHAYAFMDESAGTTSANVLVINRHTTRSLPLTIELPFSSASSVTSLKLAGDTPESNNEDEEKVTIVQTVIEDYKPGQSLKAPPASATVYRFTEAH